MRPSLAKRVPAVSYMMFLICGMLLYAKHFRYIHKIIGQYFLCRVFPSTALFKDQLIIEYRPQEQKSGIIIFPARLQTAALRKIIFPGLAAVINADITRNLLSLSFITLKRPLAIQTLSQRFLDSESVPPSSKWSISFIAMPTASDF